MISPSWDIFSTDATFWLRSSTIFLNSSGVLLIIPNFIVYRSLLPISQRLPLNEDHTSSWFILGSISETFDSEIIISFSISKILSTISSNCWLANISSYSFRVHISRSYHWKALEIALHLVLISKHVFHARCRYALSNLLGRQK